MPLLLSHYTGASRSNPSLGGGAPTYTATAGGVLGAGAPSDAIPTAIEDCPSRFLVACLLPIASTVASGQIGILSSPRSRRKKPHHIWCLVAQGSTTPRPAAMALPASVSPTLGKWRRNRHHRSCIDKRSRLKATVPLHCFNPSRRTPDGRPSFNEIPQAHGPVPWTRSTAPWTYSIGF
jgi:hypothetical protein